MVCSSSHHIAIFPFHHLLFVLLWHCWGLAVLHDEATLRLSRCHEPQNKSPRVSCKNINHLLCTFIWHPIFFHGTQNLRNLKFTHVAALTHSLPFSSPTHFSPWLENSRGNLKRYYLKKAHHPNPNCKFHIWGFSSSIYSLQLLVIWDSFKFLFPKETVLDMQWYAKLNCTAWQKTSDSYKKHKPSTSADFNTKIC